MLLRSCALVLGIIGAAASHALAGPISIATSVAEPLALPHASAVPPTGAVTVAGRTFTVDPSRAARVDNSADAPVAVYTGQPFSATTVSFLHTFVPGPALHHYRMQVAAAHRAIEVPPAPPAVASYVVTYEDGRELAIPIRFGESINDWYRVGTVGPMLWARHAHLIPLDRDSGEHAAWYAMDWINPRPDQPIKSIALRANTDTHRGYGQTITVGLATDSAAAAGRYLYVDQPPVGSDAQDGTFDAPFGSIAKAVSVARAGDTIFVRGGTYAISEPIVIETGGVEGRWLTITAFPGETPIIDGIGVRKDYRKAPYTKDAARGRYDMDLGLVQIMGRPEFVRFQGFHIRNSQQAGINAYGPEKEDRGRFVEVSFNTTERCFSMGIIVHSVDDLAIIGNRVVRPHSQLMVTNPFTGAPEVSQALAQEGIDVSRNTRFEIAFNEVYGGSKEAIDAISVSDGRIHHNYVHHCLNGIYIDSWTIPITGIEIDHNFIHHAFAGVPLSTEGSNALIDIKVHHNIVIETKSTAIDVGEATYKAQPSAVQNIVIENNTVDRPGFHAAAIDWLASGIRVSGFKENPQYKNVTVRNNIVTNAAMQPLSTNFDDLAQRNIVFDRNLQFPAVDSATDRHKQLKGYEGMLMIPPQRGLDADPLYVNPSRGDYRLRPGSPAIGAGTEGTDIGAIPAGRAWRPGFDFAGNVTAYYRGDTIYTPVEIPREKFTVFRNSLQRPSWFQIGRYGADLQRLPGGDQSFGGINWHIPSTEHRATPDVMVLRGLGSESDAESITGIPVNRKADTLAFLHTYHSGPGLDQKQPVQLFHYVIHYVDGSREKVPVKWNLHISSWHGGNLKDLPDATLAWNMPIQIRQGRYSEIRLWSMQWTNPKPDTVIATVDLVVDAPFEAGAAAVLAISTGSNAP